MDRQQMESLENTVMDFLQLNETTDTTFVGNNKSRYVSFIKINGKPILPPLIDEEKRKEMQNYKKKAIELELQLAKRKKRNATKPSSNSSEISSISNIPLSRQSTPARPATLNLTSKESGQTFVLAASGTEESLNKYAPVDCEIVSSHEKNRLFRTSLEQRLASDDFLVKSRLNKCQQSPIVEEQEADKRWSPLKIDSLNSLRIELPTKDSTDDNLEIYLDVSQNTPDTVTHSPSLMRQNSYTLLTPSPALLQYLESQKDQADGQRSQSGRKTWDLNKAKQDWDASGEELRKSSDEDCGGRDFRRNDSNGRSLQESVRNEYNSLEYDSATSPDSYASKKSVPKVAKIKCKLKGKKIRSTKSVPSPNAIEKVPFKGHSRSMQGLLYGPVPLGGDDELADLSDLLVKMKMDHEREKRELEEKQQSEIKKLEIIFQRKGAEFLNKISQPKKGNKSIYSHTCQEPGTRSLTKADARVMGDGNHNRMNEYSLSEHCLGQWGQSRRPRSARDVYPGHGQHDNDRNRRTRSMDFNQANQDTDLDVSFQEDFSQSRDTTLNNEYILETDSMSNFSSKSSTVSSEAPHTCSLIKFQGITSEEFARYNQAASKITAAARGYLTRRLLRTAHVQGLITTLKDAITCATQLHTASDIADSDIDLMKRLGRQIEAAWDAVYAVFFNTDTSTKLQLIAADRERLRAATTRTLNTTMNQKRLSSATKKSLDRKKGTTAMSKSQTSNGFSRARTCTKMTASYPSPFFSKQLN